MALTIEQVMQKLQEENQMPVIMRNVFDNLAETKETGNYQDSILFNRNIYLESSKMEQEGSMLASFEAMTYAYNKVGQLSESEDLALKTMHIYDSWGSGSKTAMDTALLNYAAACLAGGKISEALGYIDGVEQNYGYLLDEDDYRFIFAYGYKARALAALGRIAEAKEYYGFAIDLLRKYEDFAPELNMLIAEKEQL